MCKISLRFNMITHGVLPVTGFAANLIYLSPDCKAKGANIWVCFRKTTGRCLTGGGMVVDIGVFLAMVLPVMLVH